MIYYLPRCTYYYEMSLLVLNLAVMCLRFRGAGMGDVGLFINHMNSPEFFFLPRLSHLVQCYATQSHKLFHH